MSLPKHLRDYFFLFLLSISILWSGSTWAGEREFALASLANDGTIPNVNHIPSQSKITPNGRYVVFRSSQPQFVSPNTSGYQIFLRDLLNKTTELISVSDDGKYGNGSSETPTISDDGCKVVFKSDSTNLVANYQYRNSDVYLRDRCAQPKATTTLVSLNYNKEQSNAASFTPYISGNGRYVAFNSYSTDLVNGVTRQDLLYLRDLDLQKTILISESILDQLGEQAWNPALSRDGSRIAFYSSSKELVSDILPAGKNVFLYDATTIPRIRLVSSNANGTPQDFADGTGPYPGISADGHYVSFYSNAHNLVPGDNNNKYDVFVKNVDSDKKDIWRASVSSTLQEANEDTQFNSTLSEDGTWVTFWALASNLISNSSISRLVVLHNIHTGETRRVLGVDGEDLPTISGDAYGRFISNYWADKLDSRYNSTGVFVYDRHRLPVAIAKIDASTVQPAKTGDLITLDGSSSNNNANLNYTHDFFAPKAVPALIYTWTQTEGNSVTFNDPHAAKPTFTAPAEGAYTFKLVVGDTVEDSAPSTVSIQVGSGSGPGPVNQKPIANAGPDQTGALVAQLVQLNGSLSSDPDSDPNALSYSWSQISGQSLQLTGANTATPSFTPTLPDTYSFRLVVNDGKDLSTPDVVTVVVGSNTASNVPPVAEAGNDQIVTKGTEVTLDGSQSFDPDDANAQLTYQWKQIGGPLIILNDATTDSPSFIPTKIGSYSFQLVVHDELQTSSLQSVVTVTVESGATSTNELPVAVAGIAVGQKNVGTPIKLRGADSYDPDHKPKKSLKFQWIQSDGPIKVKLLSATTSAPKFTPNQPGDYVFDLSVFDGEDWSEPDSVTVHVGGEIQLSAPQDGDIWHLGTKQTVFYQTLGINPNVSLLVDLYLINPATGQLDGYVLTAKPKAKASGSFVLKIPANATSLLTEGAFLRICGKDRSYCGYSGVFSIQ